MDTSMGLNRTLLYTGVFLTAIGVALLVVDFGRPETVALTGALRLWPLGLIAIGLGIVLRRTQFSLASGLLAAAVPGLLLGATMAATPRLAVEYGVWDRIKAAYEREHQCADYGAHIDFGNVEIDPIGGCR
jgi:hypothetical protein